MWNWGNRMRKDDDGSPMPPLSRFSPQHTRERPVAPKPRVVSDIPPRPSLEIVSEPPKAARKPKKKPMPDTYFVGMEDDEPINIAVLRKALPDRFEQ
jgi:hypothetical protein